eukprot:8025261-Pyramimonas_sp.AAC.1
MASNRIKLRLDFQVSACSGIRGVGLSGACFSRALKLCRTVETQSFFLNRKQRLKAHASTSAKSAGAWPVDQVVSPAFVENQARCCDKQEPELKEFCHSIAPPAGVGFHSAHLGRGRPVAGKATGGEHARGESLGDKKIPTRRAGVHHNRYAN